MKYEPVPSIVARMPVLSGKMFQKPPHPPRPGTYFDLPSGDSCLFPESIREACVDGENRDRLTKNFKVLIKRFLLGSYDLLGFLDYWIIINLTRL